MVGLYIILDLLKGLCSVMEFLARATLVNVPSYLYVKGPEFDSLCNIIFSYLTLQVMGFCGAILANAVFALACRSTLYLQPIIAIQNLPQAASSEKFNSYSTLHIILSFYINYASIRSLVIFAQSIFLIALESIKDFPDSSKLLAKGGTFSLKLAYLIFIPVLILQIYILSADYICQLDQTISQSNTSSMIATIFMKSSKFTCEYSGLQFLTTPYNDVREIAFGAAAIISLQLWQAALIQFPRWDIAFKDLHFITRCISQTSILCLTISSASVIVKMMVFGDVSVFNLTLYLTGWTLWLFCFVPVLVHRHGSNWDKNITAEALQTFAATSRMSFIIILGISFIFLILRLGFVRAQLVITFLTIVIPALYCFIYIFVSTFLKAGPRVIIWGVPLTLILAIFIYYINHVISYHNFRDSSISTQHTTNNRNQAEAYNSNVHEYYMGNDQGSILLIWNHLMSKFVQYLGKGNATTGDWEAEEDIDGEHNNTPRHQDGHETRETNDDEIDSLLIHRNNNNNNNNNNNKNTLSVNVDDLPLFPQPLSTSRSLMSQTSNPSSVRSSVHGDAVFYRSNHNSNNNSVTQSRSQSPLRSRIPTPSLPLSSSSSSNHLGSLGLSLQSSSVHRSSHSLENLASRGNEGSSLVSLKLPTHISSNIVIQLSRRYLKFLLNMAHALAVPESLMAAMIRIFLGLVVILVLSILTFTMASVTQQRLQFFPSLLNFYEDPITGSYLFDHKIANVTLFPRNLKKQNDLLDTKKDITNNDKSFIDENIRRQTDASYESELKIPYYSACDWRWSPKSISSSHNTNLLKNKHHNDDNNNEMNRETNHRKSLNLIDFALLSELAYYDDFALGSGVQEVSQTTTTTSGRPHMQSIINKLFPDLDFQVIISKSTYEHGPMFLEIYSKILDVTIISVRGTDLGRPTDFLEDIKLYAEPGTFTVLSTFFPTIRFWTPDLTSRVIEWLCEFNSFVGLQTQSEYYRPLVSRVLEILEINKNLVDENSDEKDNINVGAKTTESRKHHRSRNTSQKSAKEVLSSRKSGKESVIMTGHSLGGGLARIVGTLTGIRSITFSPPGLGHSYRKYKYHAFSTPSSANSQNRTANQSSSNTCHENSNIIEENNNTNNTEILDTCSNKNISDSIADSENIKDSESEVNSSPTLSLSATTQYLHHQSMAVVSEYDLISSVDHQVGLIQTIQCDKHEHALENSCHTLEMSLCHLIEHCGDERFVGCNYEFSLSISLMDFINTYVWFLLPLIGLLTTLIALAIIPEIL